MSETKTPARVEPVSGKLLRVLLAEDNPADAELALWELRRAGFEIHARVVAVREEFAQCLGRDSLDIVLADYNLRDWTGMDALGMLKERGLDIPFILVTGTLGDELAVDCVKKGVSDYVLKDSLVRLPLAVTQALEEKALREERRRAEAENAQLRAAIEQASESAIMTDVNGKIQYINPAFTRVTGYTREEVLGQNPRLLKSGKHSAAFYQDLWETILAGHVWQGEIINRRKDGSLYVEQMTITPVRDESGTIVNFIAIKQDITERKKAQEALRESQRTLATLMSNLPGMAYRCRNDRSWTMDFVSEGSLELTGYQPADLIQNHSVSYAALVHPDDRERIWQEVQAALAARRPFQLTYRIRTARGQEKWVWEQGQGVVSASGEFLLVEGFITDITDRREAQRRLEERTTHLTALIENSPLAICMLDTRYRLKMCNPAFEHLFGYRHAEIIGSNVIELIVPPEYRAEVTELKRHIEAGGIGHVTTRRRRQDGTLVDVELYAVPLQVGKDWLGSFVIYEDIRERKQAEAERIRALELKAANEALALADQRKSEFLADMSHELRSPLNSILGYSELLLDEKDGLEAKQREGLTIIYDKAQHLLSLVNDLLDLARIESGQAMLECGVIAVKDQCLRTLDTFAPGLREKNLHSTVEVEPRELTAYADPRRLEQVLTNLVSNAVRFTEQGAITLQARPRNGQVEVCVRDTGVGIAPDDLEHIFDKFYQAHRRAEGSGRGTGLGLTITRQLVELQGGKIWVESTPGQGTRYFFTLPSALPAPTRSRAEEDTHE